METGKDEMLWHINSKCNYRYFVDKNKTKNTPNGEIKLAAVWGRYSMFRVKGKNRRTLSLIVVLSWKGTSKPPQWLLSK